jgi:hypothetical protein
MTLLATSAADANGDGFGQLLAFADDGKLIGAFSDDPRIVDPRGLGVDPVDGLLFVNSGSNRILALDRCGRVVRATKIVDRLNPGGGNFGPDGRYCVGLRSERTIMAFAPRLDTAGEYVFLRTSFLFRAVSPSGRTALSSLRPVLDRARKATTPFWHSIPVAGYCRHGGSAIPISAHSISRLRRTATSSRAANIRLAPKTPLRLSANMTVPTGIWSGF